MKITETTNSRGNKDICIDFDGIMDMRQYVLDGTRGKDYYVSSKGGRSFFESESIEEADNLLVHGWELGRTELTAKVDNLSRSVEEMVGYRRDVTGIFFDVGSVVSGEPECWFEPELEEKRNSIKVVLNGITSSGISTTAIQNRGAAIVCLLDTLQRAGWAIELEVCCKSYRPFGSAKRNKDHILSRVPIGCSPLDLDSLAFTLAHPSFPRRFMYSVHDVWSGTCCHRAGCHGSPTDLTPEEIGENVMYFGSVGWDQYGNGLDQFGTMEKATAWLRKKLEELTGEKQEG